MNGPKVLLGVLVLCIVLLLFFSTKEAFETQENNIQDRTNDLAVRTNPLKNPAAQIGISKKDAEKLRNVTAAALGGNVKEGYSDSDNTPRIDGEDSLLGLIKFCRDNGSGGNPFSNPKFAENCGVCYSSGTTGPDSIPFTEPTGVLVYEEDKKDALEEQERKRYPFPRVIPSLGAAICVGASKGDNAKPVLAITAKDAASYMKRADCVSKGVVDNKGCATCLPTGRISYVSPDTTISALSLHLFGQGVATVSVGGQTIGQQTLSLTQPVTFNLGKAKEGASLVIKCEKGTSNDGPYVFGAIQGENPNQELFLIDVYDSIEKNQKTGAKPPSGRPIEVTLNKKMSLVRINAPGNETSMVLEGKIPMTFVQWGDLAAYDCPKGPFLTTPDSAELFVRDPCLRPKEQNGSNVSDQCIISRLEENDCASGTWASSPKEALNLWKKETPNWKNLTGTADFLKSFTTWLRSLVVGQGGKPARTETDIAVAMGAKKVDLSTPCDKFLTSNDIPDKDCMKYLYYNKGATNKRIGATYAGFEDYEEQEEKKTFEEAFQNPVVEASDAGLWNPDRQGVTEITKCAMTKTGTGVERVKGCIATEWDIAKNQSLDLTKENAQGGRLTSWKNVIGIPVAQQQTGGVLVGANGTVTGTALTCDTGLPASFVPQYNKAIARGFTIPRDYTFKFTININRVVMNRGHMTVFHFSQGDNIATFGDRALAIWINPNSSSLHIRWDLQRQNNFGIDTVNLPLGTPVTVEIVQKGTTTNITMTAIGFRQTYSIPNTNGNRYTGPVTVWGGDPWYNNAWEASVTNVCLTRG